MRLFLLWLLLIAATGPAEAALQKSEAAFFVDFAQPPAIVRIFQGARYETNSHTLLFSTAMQYAEIEQFRSLHGINAMTVGGWFFPRRSGEQTFLFRGAPEIGPLGERFFPRSEKFVNFVLGTDAHGFLMGTINGNGTMPFAHVTVDEVGFDAWHQLVLVKDAQGYQRFYHNGTLVHTDRDSAHAPRIWPFEDTVAESIRIAVPLGGSVGEAWGFARELTAAEIREDYLAKRTRYKPALPVQPVALREMDARFSSGLWKDRLEAQTWPQTRQRILVAVTNILGQFPKEKVSLDPEIISETDCGSYIRRKVSIQVQKGDRMPAWLLVPKAVQKRLPAVICFYGTTSGAGKETTVGLSGPKPGTPAAKNRGFAIDIVEAGMIAFAPDYLRDGERINPGRQPYDTTDFYETFPDWSLVGKDVWDNARAIDYLQGLRIVDANRIGIVGHSYGGHSAIFAAALEPRIKVIVANGPVSDFLHHGMHWAVPKGARNSQSLPGLRPYVLDRTLPLPVTFYEFTSLIAPRPLWLGQAVGERRPMDEENHAAVRQVYEVLGSPEKVRYMWYAGDHDFAPVARAAGVDWLRHWFARIK